MHVYATWRFFVGICKALSMGGHYEYIRIQNLQPSIHIRPRNAGGCMYRIYVRISYTCINIHVRTRSTTMRNKNTGAKIFPAICRAMEYATLQINTYAYMYVCVYMHVCMYTCIGTYMYVYWIYLQDHEARICIYIFAYMHSWLHAVIMHYIHSRIYLYTHTGIHTYTYTEDYAVIMYYTYMHIYTHTYSHSYKHTYNKDTPHHQVLYIHTHLYIYTGVYIYTHMY
jgi:hypothetical protein